MLEDLQQHALVNCGPKVGYLSHTPWVSVGSGFPQKSLGKELFRDSSPIITSTPDFSPYLHIPGSPGAHHISLGLPRQGSGRLRLRLSAKGM